MLPKEWCCMQEYCGPFLQAFSFTHDPLHLAVAERAFNISSEYFKDEAFGGVYWSVDYKGNRLETRKQIYGLAFTIYGMSEYYCAHTR